MMVINHDDAKFSMVALDCGEIVEIVVFDGG